MEVIHNFKYGKSRAAHELIFSILQDNICSFEHVDCIVPVPQHFRRYILRGYNQSVVIAKMVSKIVRRPVSLRALAKRRATPSQVGKTLKDRNENLKGAFARPRFLPQSVAGKKVLLVDDVITSGSTIDECSRILRKAGARRIDVLTLAKTL